MKYDTKDIVQSTDAKRRLRELIEQSRTIELKELSNSRTAKQNRAIHKFFVIICEQLNEIGQEFCYTGIKGLPLTTRYTPYIVKEFFWREIQLTLFSIESTKYLDTKMINEIADVMIKYFAEKGIVRDFPRKELN